MNDQCTKLRWVGLLGAITVCVPVAFAQADDEDIFELSPFEVSAEESDGYLATSTLAGTRIRTDLRDLSTPITAITAEFLEDTASTDNQDLLVYTTGTEVGGLFGNFGGFGNGQGLSDRGALLRPNNNTRVRGLEAADNTRNYFLSSIPWDSYNVDRVEIQRGPNSVLFGVGSPAGIINTNTKVSSFSENFGKLELQVGEKGSIRGVFDYNYELVDDLLAVRVIAMRNDHKFEQEPAFKEDERYFLTGTWSPQIFDESWASKLQVRATFETAEIVANNPRILPPSDAISIWFEDSAGDGVNDLIGLNKGVFDMFLYNIAGGGDPTRNQESEVLVPMYQPGLQQLDSGALNNGGLGFFFQNGSSIPFLVSQQSRRQTPGAFGADFVVNNVISMPYASPMRSNGYNDYSKEINRIDRNNGIPDPQRRFPLADRNYYQDRSLTDPTIFDFYNNLIDGDNKRELTDWDYRNISLSQSFWDNRAGVELVYDSQSFKERRGGATWSRPFIGIDTNSQLQHQFVKYDRVPDPTYDPDAGTGRADGLLDASTYRVPGFTPSAAQPYANPNAGAAILAGGLSDNTQRGNKRQTYRATAYYEFRASDIFDEEGWLSMLIGKHIFTGLWTEETINESLARFEPAISELAWADSLFTGASNKKINESYRGISPIIYLSDPLFDRSSASGLNLGPITTLYNPAGMYDGHHFDVTWKHPMDPGAPGYVDPGASTFINWKGDGSINPDSAGIQGDNPANYVGWTTKPVTIFNADDGYQDDLTFNYDEREEVVESNALVWQGKFLGGHIVPTVGWRKDKLKTYTSPPIKDSNGVAAQEFDSLNLINQDEIENVSWGVVGHVPNDWIKNLPILSGLSVYYNYGENNKVQTRYNYDGNPLENPSGESKDYGIVVSAFDDKFTVKVGKYETRSINADLVGGGSMLGSNAYYLYQLEAWAMSDVLIYSMGLAGLDPNRQWHWGWAHIAEGWSTDWWGGWPGDPTLDVYRNHPVTQEQLAVMDDAVANADPQFFINYDIPLDIPAVQEAYNIWRTTDNIQPLVDEVADVFPIGGDTAGLGSLSDGQINGISPNGTINNLSEGYEIEINYRPIPNWNIQINAAKTTAFREDLGQPMLDFIETQYSKLQGPMGDIRLWWGGDNEIRKYYEDNIIAALEFQKESVGFSVPELRPWRFAFVTNYSFTDGRFKGLNIGGSYRWQDALVLGYRLKDDNSGLDVTKPMKGPEDDHLDLWVGYEMDLSPRVGWRIQLNIRNAFENDNLVPIAANPDGTISSYRIAQGMSWTLTNTFSF
ncbi:MAG: TonB-dependent receptor plug domain-containing protein [Puniceicoccaceae bacterium]